MITYTRGDLFETNCPVIAHGVNCMGSFNAGVAYQIRKKYPNAYKSYMRKFANEGWVLGDVQYVMVGNDDLDRTIANCATQRGYGYSEGQKIFVDYPAVKKCFKKLFGHCNRFGISCAMPKIGAGLAGGDWNIIEKIILELIEVKSVDVYVYSL